MIPTTAHAPHLTAECKYPEPSSTPPLPAALATLTGADPNQSSSLPKENSSAAPPLAALPLEAPSNSGVALVTLDEMSNNPTARMAHSLALAACVHDKHRSITAAESLVELLEATTDPEIKPYIAEQLAVVIEKSFNYDVMDEAAEGLALYYRSQSAPSKKEAVEDTVDVRIAKILAKTTSTSDKLTSRKAIDSLKAQMIYTGNPQTRKQIAEQLARVIRIAPLYETKEIARKALEKYHESKYDQLLLKKPNPSLSNCSCVVS